MATLPIYLYGNDILKKKAKNVTEVTDADVKLVKDMFETMHESNGIGLAANQIGELKQILVDKINAFLDAHRKKREHAAKDVKLMMHDGKLAKEMWARKYE